MRRRITAQLSGMRLHEKALTRSGCPSVATRPTFLGPVADEALIRDPEVFVLGRPGLGQGAVRKAQLMRWLFGEYLCHRYFDGRPLLVVLDEAANVEPLVAINLRETAPQGPLDPLAFGPAGRRESPGR